MLKIEKGPKVRDASWSWIGELIKERVKESGHGLIEPETGIEPFIKPKPESTTTARSGVSRYGRC